MSSTSSDSGIKALPWLLALVFFLCWFWGTILLYVGERLTVAGYPWLSFGGFCFWIIGWVRARKDILGDLPGRPGALGWNMVLYIALFAFANGFVTLLLKEEIRIGFGIDVISRILRFIVEVIWGLLLFIPACGALLMLLWRVTRRDWEEVPPMMFWVSVAMLVVLVFSHVGMRLYVMVAP